MLDDNQYLFIRPSVYGIEFSLVTVVNMVKYTISYIVTDFYGHKVHDILVAESVLIFLQKKTENARN